MRLLKLLAVPAMTLFSFLLAVPASAWSASTPASAPAEVRNASFSFTCYQSHGQIGVTLKGDPEGFTNNLYLFFNLYAEGSNNVLDEMTMTLQPGSNSTTYYFEPVSSLSNASTFVVKLMKVASDKLGTQPVDLVFDLPTGNVDSSTGLPYTVGTTAACVPTSPSPSASVSAAPTPKASATPVATLAETGGFDYRYPIIGLVFVVAGLVVFVIGASRRRRPIGSK